MADPSAQREVMPQNSQPASLSFNSARPLSLVPPNGAHPSFHYPQVYVDPVAAAAFYQQRQHGVQQQPHTSQPAASQPHPSHTQQVQRTQSHVRPVTTQAQPPYYIPDMATVALQQMQLQTMLQMQAHQAHPNPALQQRQDTAQLPQQAQQIVPHHTTGTSQPSIHGVLPVPPHMNLVQQAQSVLPHGVLGMIPNSLPHSSGMPIVPEAQMASAYRIGRYTPAERKIRLERYREKRAQRNYNRRVKYDCRKQIADKRRRVQGRFVKREEEMALAAATEHSGPVGHIANGHTNGTSDQHRNSEATDVTGDETKLMHPESSGSGSSMRQLEVTVHNVGPGDSATGREQESFCEQSDQMLQTFR